MGYESNIAYIVNSSMSRLLIEGVASQPRWSLQQPCASTKTSTGWSERGGALALTAA